MRGYVTWLASSRSAKRRSRSPVMDVILNLAVLSTLWATLEVLKETKLVFDWRGTTSTGAGMSTKVLVKVVKSWSRQGRNG